MNLQSAFIKVKLYAIIVFSFLVPFHGNAQLNFNVDFATANGPALVKDKFAVYQTTLGSISRVNTNMPKLSEANIKHFRYELGWGKNEEFSAPQITGTASNPQYNFGELDQLVNGLKTNGVTPLYAMCYNPRPLQNNPADGNNWQSVPNNLAAWQRICGDYAAHFKAMGTNPMYEIWNEPDLNGIFFTGTTNDYINIYKNAVAGIHAAEPTAIIGGPAVSGANLDWYKNFLNGIGTTPINFLSGHIYDSNYRQLISTMRQALSETGRTNLPIYLTEYCSFDNLNSQEVSSTGIASKAQGASRFFGDVRNLLTYIDVKKVYFAQWIDPETRSCPTCAWQSWADKMGMIDLSNQRKALYNAFKLYGSMPEARKLVSPEIQAGIGSMASSDPNNASVVFWNEGTAQQSISATFNNLPFSSGKMEIYRIDASNASKYDGAGENFTILSTTNITSNSAYLNTSIPVNGVLFVKMYPSTPPPPPINRVINPGFESGSISPWATWIGTGSAGISTTKRTGSYSGWAGAGSAYLYQVVSGLSPNTSYNLSFYVQNTTLNGSSVLVGVKNMGTAEVSQSVANTSNAWIPVNLTFSTGASNSTAEIYLWVNAFSTWGFIDDISLTSTSGARLKSSTLSGGIGNEILKITPENKLVESAVKLNLYPNPATLNVTIDWTILNATYVDISVINLEGIVVYSKHIKNANRFELKTAEFKSGVYTVIVKDEKSMIYNKLLIFQ